ncbi:galanin peptides-like [Crotalus adamanteus]|uniref:Galanin peptides-like n=1 Tax=Crotalus adamanteus TaxID=8729 RepID=A0AAW1B0A8_CROAD
MLFGDCFGVTFVPKDKRGWTLNSAGYLLGPPPVLQPSDYSILQTLMDFLSYLNLRDQRVIGRLLLQMSEESMQQ